MFVLFYCSIYFILLYMKPHHYGLLQYCLLLPLPKTCDFESFSRLLLRHCTLHWLFLSASAAASGTCRRMTSLSGRCTVDRYPDVTHTYIHLDTITHQICHLSIWWLVVDDIFDALVVGETSKTVITITDYRLWWRRAVDWRRISRRMWWSERFHLTSTCCMPGHAVIYQHSCIAASCRSFKLIFYCLLHSSPLAIIAPHEAANLRITYKTT